MIKNLWLMFAIIAVTLSFLVIGMSIGGGRQDLKFEECLQAVNEAIPDPNEIQERSDFLRNCYE